MRTGKLDEISIAYRREVLEIIRRAGRGHIAPAFSVIEIIRALYEDILQHDPAQPLWTDRDRFILSKGHACLALYVALARHGYFPQEELFSFCRFGARLGGHPEYGKPPGIEASTGSLGHGLALGIGMALNGILEGREYRVFVLLGDGECNEGAVWEGALCAAKHKLANLTVLIDYNRMQCYGRISEILPLKPFAEKWRSFGFGVDEVDGHDRGAVRQVLQTIPLVPGRPSAILCHTVKGKGIPSIEGDPAWHHKTGLKPEVIDSLIRELEDGQ